MKMMRLITEENRYTVVVDSAVVKIVGQSFEQKARGFSMVVVKGNNEGENLVVAGREAGLIDEDIFFIAHSLFVQLPEDSIEVSFLYEDLNVSKDRFRRFESTKRSI